MKKIVMIGGGVAGLSAGIYAKQNGFDAEIYEKHSIAGGECTGWRRGDYVIDNCVHWLTGTREGSDLYEIWKNIGVIGEGIELIQGEIFYTVEWEGQKISLWRDLERTRMEMLALSPEDAEEINKLITYTGYAQSMEIPVEKPFDMMMPWEYLKMGMGMAQMGKVMKEYGKITVEEFSRRFKHPLLQKCIKEYMAPEYMAYTYIVSYATFSSGNGAIPQGGSLGMVKRMEDRFKSLGGKIYTGKEVEAIVLVGKKATGIKLADGSFREADYVIAACDTNITFGKLLPETFMDKKLRYTYEDRKNNPVSSGFQVAFAVEDEMEELKETLLFSIRDLKIGTRTVNRMGVRNFRHYGDWIAPKGHTVLQSNFLQWEDDYEYWKELYRNQEAYQTCKQKLAEEILLRILERFPAYAGKIKVLDVWTPGTYARYCGAYKGAYMSFVSTKKTKHSVFKGCIKGLDNVFLASQWQQSPGGLPTAAAMGKFAVQRIFRA